MNMKKTLVFMLAMSLLVSLASFASAIVTPGNTDATADIGTAGTLTTTNAVSTTAEGGNVTKLNLTTSSSTLKWQGYYGDVSGNVALGIGSDVMYNFGAFEPTVVLATTNNGYSWSALEAASEADVDTVWNFDSSDKDSASSTLTNDVTISGLPQSRGTSTLDNSSANAFDMAVYDDSTSAAKDNFAFGAAVYTAKAGFDASNVEYQIMVPTTEDGTDTYYFYLSME